MSTISFSQELQDLLNPLPKFADPEDDHDEATRARVSDAFAGDVDDDDDEEVGGAGALRRRNAIMLAEGDGRYLGKAVSRQQLLMDVDQNDEDEEEAEDGSVEELEADEEEADADFHEQTGGTDDLRVSQEDDGEEDQMEEDEDGVEEEEEEGAMSTFSKEKLDEEVEKAEAVRKQLALWEQLLEARIKMQKALGSANRLPRPHALPHFRARGGDRQAGAAEDARKALKALQRSLLDLHQLLIRQSATPVLLGQDEDEEDEEGRAAKRKPDMSDDPEVASERFAAFRPYRDATLRKWHDRTRLSSGKRGGGDFGAFERDVVGQVEQILTDKERLVRRTQTRRSEYRVLGTGEEPDHADARNPSEERLDGPTPARGERAKDTDEDVFDDDDFYHQLLRELIERKTGGSDAADRQVAAGRQWLRIQKLRSKIKKKVDTKASKGRKVRFDAHTKLLNFMAPVLRDDGALAHDARTELYRGLFGHADSAYL
ncbi:protein AATF [Phyllopteryx taeniolatus]|uniref:protein AATF n=1 Tax=Phyllopteryx taeniolatus TaxID=161469 RepID=UPI002AD26A04|nr:protein AATF [Phyllopteryx taeniolatus]